MERLEAATRVNTPIYFAFTNLVVPRMNALAQEVKIKEIYDAKHRQKFDPMPRREYFTNLLKLQAELIKMHHWVEQTNALFLLPPRAGLGSNRVTSNLGSFELHFNVLLNMQ